MRGTYRFTTSLIISAVLLSLQAFKASAQQPSRIRTAYYDTAQTKRRAVYGISLRGSRPDTVAHGPYRRYWRSGSLEEIGHFTNGQADSVWTRYYPAKAGQTPVLSRRLPMQNGQPNGPFTVFHPNGQLAQRGTFHQGVLVDSLVTTTKTGARRLLGLFTGSASSGLQGSFRQWYAAYTAQTLHIDWFKHQNLSIDNPYPAKDSGRYWLGHLAAGHLVRAFTEYDANGQPRVRMSYTPQGELRMATLYYPSAWMRHELLNAYEQIPADSIIPSQPYWRWQALGREPYYLQQHWEVGDAMPRDRVLRSVFIYDKHEMYMSANVVGALRIDSTRLKTRTKGQPKGGYPTAAPLLPECSGLYALYMANGQPAWRPTAADGDAPARRYPPLSHYRQPRDLQLVPGGSRWRFGEADTTGATHRPARQRVTALPEGGRVVETQRKTLTYFPNGQLRGVERRQWLGRVVDRDYYPNGRLKMISRKRFFSTSIHTWDEEGKMRKSVQRRKFSFFGYHFIRSRDGRKRWLVNRSGQLVQPLKRKHQNPRPNKGG